MKTISSNTNSNSNSRALSKSGNVSERVTKGFANSQSYQFLNRNAFHVSSLVKTRLIY